MELEMIVDIFQFPEFHVTTLDVSINDVMRIKVMQFCMLQRCK